jgi:hypothetical protein
MQVAIVKLDQTLCQLGSSTTVHGYYKWEETE